MNDKEAMASLGEEYSGSGARTDDICTDDPGLRATIHGSLKERSFPLPPPRPLPPGYTHCHCRYCLSAAKLSASQTLARSLFPDFSASSVSASLAGN